MCHSKNLMLVMLSSRETCISGGAFAVSVNPPPKHIQPHSATRSRDTNHFETFKTWRSLACATWKCEETFYSSSTTDPD